ncbi:MAG: hypothetical protein EBT95_03180 [Verrucomicrobia bacterium]|nr:hypothetical protein [Verrucomicrobiota bacterium]
MLLKVAEVEELITLTSVSGSLVFLVQTMVDMQQPTHLPLQHMLEVEVEQVLLEQMLLLTMLLYQVVILLLDMVHLVLHNFSSFHKMETLEDMRLQVVT